MPMIGHVFSWNFSTVLTNPNTWQVPVGAGGGPIAQHLGLLEFGRVDLVIDIPANGSGDTIDLVLQTTYDPAGAAGSWKDIGRTASIANAAAASSPAFVLTRGGSGTAAAPQLVNTLDLTPTIAVSTIYPQQLGAGLRLIFKTGAAPTSVLAIVVRAVASP